MAGIDILKRITRRWQLVQVANALLLAGGVTFFVYSIFLINENDQLLLSVGILFIPAFIAGLLVFKPWIITIKQSARWVDHQLDESQNSAYLLVQQDDNISTLGLIQQKRVSDLLVTHSSKLGWPDSLRTGTIWFVGLVFLGFCVQAWSLKHPTSIEEASISSMQFSSVTENENLKTPIKIISQELSISFPTYTRKRSIKTTDLNISALEGSLLKWQLKLSEATVEVTLVTHTGKSFELNKIGDLYTVSSELKENGFYKFVYKDLDGEVFETNLYSLESIPDVPPSVEINSLERFTLLEIKDSKTIAFTSTLADDYGLAAASIIATVSRGSGESVKFREERMEFDSELKIGSKQAVLKKKIDLDQLKMTPGDELYFYVEAFDNKSPKANRTRTETYFFSIRDTTNVQFSLEGSLGVDLMPEYFRSQRQIIIDTEKLIKTRGKGIKHDFDSKSNELGFDQKALRLKYGQFMGEEFETGITESSIPEEIEEGHDHDHAEDGIEEKDPLEEYSHVHDSENEHNLVPEEEKEEDPLEEYAHVHDDPEEATLYTKSIKGKLRAAMTEMWDAELYLRLYQPEKSLPYQYRALKLIKEIKNHARIYVHRIGFDPPPIKEENRLTGDLEAIENTKVASDLKTRNTYPAISRSIVYLDSLIINKEVTYKAVIFKNAGIELAGLAVDKPGKYFKALQTLQKLNLNQVPENRLQEVFVGLQGDLTAAIPKENVLLQSGTKQQDQLIDLFLLELQREVYE